MVGHLSVAMLFVPGRRIDRLSRHTPDMCLTHFIGVTKTGQLRGARRPASCGARARGSLLDTLMFTLLR